MRHGSLSSKIQPAAADVARSDMDVSEGCGEKEAAQDGDAQETLSPHGTWIDYEVAMVKSCARACSLV